jgi:hypothetical protein
MTTHISPAENSPSEKEIDLLDILVIISARIKFIVLLTLLGAFIGWLTTLGIPKPFNSTSTLNVEAFKQDEKYPKFKSEVIVSLINNNQEFKELTQDGRFGDFSKITPSVSAKDRLLIITTSASAPSKAVELNEKVLETVYRLTAAQGTKATQLDSIIESEKNRLAQISQTLLDVEKSKSARSEIDARLINNLLNYKLERELSIARLQDELEGVTENNIIQAPSVPTHPTPGKEKLNIAIYAGIGLFIALFFTFFQLFISSMRNTPENKEKIDTIAKNIGLKK